MSPAHPLLVISTMNQLLNVLFSLLVSLWFISVSSALIFQIKAYGVMSCVSRDC